MEQNHFSPDARMVSFCRFRQSCKTPVLAEITYLWLNNHRFSEGLKCYCVVQKKVRRIHSFLITDSICHSSLPRTVLEKVTLTTI